MRFVLGLAAAVALSAAGPAPVSGPLVSCDRWPRATNLVSWTVDVMRIEGLENATETAQGKAFFEWLRLFSRMAVGGMIQAYRRAARQRALRHRRPQDSLRLRLGLTATPPAASRKRRGRNTSATRARPSACCVQHEDGGYHTMYRLRWTAATALSTRATATILWSATSPARACWTGARSASTRTSSAIALTATAAARSSRSSALEWERALLLNPGWFDSEQQWQDAGAPKEYVFGEQPIPDGHALPRHGFHAVEGRHHRALLGQLGAQVLPAGGQAHAARVALSAVGAVLPGDGNVTGRQLAEARS